MELGNGGARCGDRRLRCGMACRGYMEWRLEETRTSVVLWFVGLMTACKIWFR